MSEYNPSCSKLFGEIYRDINDVVKLIDQVSINQMNSSQRNSLELMETKLRLTQKRIVKTIVNDAVEQVIEDQLSLCSPNRESDHDKEWENHENEFNLRRAKELIRRIEQKAKSMNRAVVCAVCNHSAHPIAVHCMDEAYIASYDVAVHKAYTSAALKMSTSVLKGLSQPGKEFYGVQYTNQGRIVIFGGGEPLYYKNKLVGALGVSGASESEDTALAKFGKDILEEVMKC